MKPEKGLKVALAVEKLSDEGKAVALTQIEGLIAHFPYARSDLSNKVM